MRVLHVIPSVSERSGGPAQAIVPMCLALQKQGVDVLIITTNSGMEARTSHSDPQNGSKPDGQVQNYKGIPTRFFPVQLGQSFKYSRSLAGWLDKNVRDFDLVHIHAVFNHACIAAANSCRRQNVPYIIRPLGTLDPWSMKRKSWRKAVFWHLIGKGMLRAAATVHYTSSIEKEAAESSMRLNHGSVVPLGVDVNRFEKSLDPGSPHPFNGLAQRPYVLAMSRLHPKKGLDVLVDAFLRVREDPRFSDWQLILAGEGDSYYVSRLRKQISSAISGESVILTGWIDGDEKLFALRHAALLALPSHHENFGMCVVEALASGVPVLISPNVNLARDIETAGAGWIASVDVAAVETALREALDSEDERRRRGCNGANLARKFDWSLIGEDLSSLYRQLAVL